MKTTTTESKQIDILGDGSRLSAGEVLATLLKQWRKRLGYFSVFAAAPALLVSQVQEAPADDDTKRPEATAADRAARFFKKLNLNGNNRQLFRRQSGFLLPHQRNNFALLTAVAGGDDCPGLRIPGGTYTAAAPYVDSGDTTGANSTINRVNYYYYYSFDARGPDHIYSFTITGRGPAPMIQVSTTSPTYRPLVYVLPGGYRGACPAGTGNSNVYVLVSSSAAPGGTAILSFSQMNFLPLNVPLHLFVDGAVPDASGAGPYTVRMQDVTVSSSVCSNPIDCPEFFLYQQYIDFLSREPDPPGMAGWLGVLNNCAAGDTSCDRIHVSAAFFQSPEFLQRGYFLYRFYPVAFGRKPDYDEFREDFWKVNGFRTDDQLEAGKLQFITEFMNRPAFITKFGGLNNTQYVDTLLSTAGITHPARDLWIRALDNNTRTRLQVLREISETTQVYEKYYNQAFVVMQYFGYLRRQPDALYLNWLAYLEATGDYRTMINGFLNSLEYRARFGP
jgi:hypothetical protein